MYSTGGKKLYAVRNADGTFKDVQTYQRAHKADMSHKSAAEKVADAKRAAKKAVTKAVKAVKKVATKAAKKVGAKKAAKKSSRKK
ncbi:MAG TPA: hypothetical protein VHW73_10560 [Rudaea sp.]|jgi:hypothetical protein|nr:hypothetical protein [Rudaea sp.]